MIPWIRLGVGWWFGLISSINYRVYLKWKVFNDTEAQKKRRHQQSSAIANDKCLRLWAEVWGWFLKSLMWRYWGRSVFSIEHFCCYCYCLAISPKVRNVDCMKTAYVANRMKHERNNKNRTQRKFDRKPRLINHINITHYRANVCQVVLESLNNSDFRALWKYITWIAGAAKMSEKSSSQQR